MRTLQFMAMAARTYDKPKTEAMAQAARSRRIRAHSRHSRFDLSGVMGSPGGAEAGPCGDLPCFITVHH